MTQDRDSAAPVSFDLTRDRRLRLIVLAALLFLCAGMWLYVQLTGPREYAYRVHARIIWEVPLHRGGFSSPRVADLNADGVFDVLVGSGHEGVIDIRDKESELATNRFGIFSALDGKTGAVLWQHRVEDEVFTTTPLLDINRDGTSDVFVGGRIREVYALNGRDGAPLWQLTKSNPKTKFPDANFVSLVRLGDEDGDGMDDLLMIQSGGNDLVRPAAHGYLVSAASGKIIRQHLLPDRKESYASPAVDDRGGETFLYTGTGGETLPGNIVKLNLATFEEVWHVSSAPPASPDDKKSLQGKGFTASPLLVDLDGDGAFEVIEAGMNGGVYCLSAVDGSRRWTYLDEVCEAYSSPAVGAFGGDETRDVIASFSRGIYPDYENAVLLWLDGRTGSVLHRKQFDPPHHSNSSSPLVLDANHDGKDEVLIVLSHASQNEPKAGNRMLMFDGGRDKRPVLDLTIPGYSATTPYLGDLDGNGFLDIVHVSGKECIRLQVHVEIDHPEGKREVMPRVKWGQFRGPDGRGVDHAGSRS